MESVDLAVNARHRTTTPGENGIGGARPRLIFYGNAITPAEDPEFERNRGELVGVSTPAQVQVLVSLNVLYILSVKQTGIYFVLTFLYTPYKTE